MTDIGQSRNTIQAHTSNPKREDKSPLTQRLLNSSMASLNSVGMTFEEKLNITKHRMMEQQNRTMRIVESKRDFKEKQLRMSASLTQKLKKAERFAQK